MANKKKKIKKGNAHKKASKKIAKQNNTTNNQINWWLIGILLITFISFSPTLDNLFVNWDDDRNLYENEVVLNLDQWDNIQELFSSTVIGNYNPLSNFVLGMNHQLMEGSDYYLASFHFINVLLHLFCVYLVFLLGGKLGLRKNAQIILALLFALHPMRVESVAWVTEIKDVLYASFFLSGMYLYSKRKVSDHSFPLGVFILFAIGLFAKIQMVVFPLALVAIDYLRGEKNLVRSGLRHWPFFVGSLIFGIAGIFALQGDGSLEANSTFALWERIFIGAYSWCVYLIKSIVPFRLSPLYPYPPTLSIWHYLSIVPFLASLGGIFWMWKKDKKVAFFGGFFFLVNIIFLLQILGAGQGYLADRFTYVAYFGLFFIYAYYLDQWMSQERWKSILPYALTAVGILYAIMTYRQCDVWQNSGTLWTHVLKYYQHSTLPYGNRANFYRDSGDFDKALEDYSASIRLKPQNPAPYNSRAKLYFSMNQDQKALDDYMQAVKLDPANMEYLVNRGAAYAKLGEMDQALADLSQVVKINPNNANAFLNRSLVWQEKGNFKMTLSDLDAYLRLKPQHADIWYEKGRIQRYLGQHDEALQSLNRAIELHSQNGIYYRERAKVHFVKENFNQAVLDAKMAQQWGAKLESELVDALRGKGLM